MAVTVTRSASARAARTAARVASHQSPERALGPPGGGHPDAVPGRAPAEDAAVGPGHEGLDPARPQVDAKDRLPTVTLPFTYLLCNVGSTHVK